MATNVVIRGTAVTWGIPATAKTAANALVEGIVQSFEVGRGAGNEEVTDEDGDFVSSVSHGHFNTIDIEIRVTDTAPELPEVDTPITGLGTIDGVDFDAGQVLIKEPKLVRRAAASAVVTFACKHYPYMPADPA